MTEIQPQKDEANLYELLPEAPTKSSERSHPRASSRRYLLPILLVGLALVINILAAYTPKASNGIGEFTQEVAEMSPADRVAAAQGLAVSGDRHYTEGYQGFDDVDILATALVEYREAWHLITRQQYPAGREGLLVVDSPACRTLHGKLKQRIAQLIADLEP